MRHPPPRARLEAAQLGRAYRVRWALWREAVEAWFRAELGDRADGAARVDAKSLDDAYSEIFSAAGLTPAIERTAKATAKASRRYVTKVADRAVGWSSVEQQAVERFRNENLSLITKLGEDQRVRLARIFRPAQAAGMRWEAVAPEVAKTLGIGERHAKLIARDQTNKLNSQLAEAHQRAAGADEYVWRTSRGMSVRGRPDGLYPDSESNHWKLEGTIQRWDRPPITNPVTGERNHPGRDIQCMCTAEPVLKVLGDRGGRAPEYTNPNRVAGGKLAAQTRANAAKRAGKPAEPDPRHAPLPRSAVPRVVRRRGKQF